MISGDRVSHVNKQASNFPVGLLLRSPKERLQAKLSRKPSNGALQSKILNTDMRPTESKVVRQPAKSKIRRHHNNRLSSVFHYSPNLRTSEARGQSKGCRSLAGDLHGAADNPESVSTQKSVPGILKIFGSDICHGTNYKSVLATSHSSAKELVNEALNRYCLEKENPNDYVLCDVIGQTSSDNHWKRKCFRVVGDTERPLVLQSLWKPKEGFSRRFEIQLKASIKEENMKNWDRVAGFNAQAHKLQKSCSRVTSLFMDDNSGKDPKDLNIWRSLSEMDLLALGKEANRARRSTLEEESQADKGVPQPSSKEEEAESDRDNSTQYCIHPPFDFPYFLLLQGYSQRQDFIIYLMSGMTTIFGCCKELRNSEDEKKVTVDILLFAPDVLPQHCSIHRLDSRTHNPADERAKTVTTLKPLKGALVTRNGVLLREEVELNPGDLVGLGKHYLFMFKDPNGTSGSVQTPLWMTTLCARSDTSSPRSTYGSSVSSKRLDRKSLPPHWRIMGSKTASLSYELEQEDKVLERILYTLDHYGTDPKLTPAFLLSLCIEHSALTFELMHFRQLLLRIANQIQLITWEETKKLAAVQQNMTSKDKEPDDLQLHATPELIPGLLVLVLWMANSIELLHFIQHEVPQLLHCRPEGDKGGLSDNDMSSTQATCEEAMTVLEEVLLFTFQQSVYYLTKSMYTALSGLLDENPFSEDGQLRVPTGLSRVLEVLKEALGLLTSFQVHADISLQLFAYLFFFINASLFNALMDRGSVAGFYHWSRGVQIRANLDLLMDWIQSIGLGDLSTKHFQTLSAAVNLLATPKETLLQASWSSLRAEFAALNPAQLHHMLREYNCNKACPTGWIPSPEDSQDAVRTDEILQSFDNHPPLILPSNAFHLELGKAVAEPGLFEQFTRLQEFIHQLPRGKTQDAGEETLNMTTSDSHLRTSPFVGGIQDQVHLDTPDPETSPEAEQDSTTGPAASTRPQGCYRDLSSCEAVLTQKLKNLELQNALPGQGDVGYHKSLALDPSCLLTPPNTPQGLEPATVEADLQERAPQERRVSNGAEERTGNAEEKEEEDGNAEEVFTVELHRGPRGLGLVVVDGMKTPLRMSGIYVKSVVPHSPADQCHKLDTGDCILAVNGISLVGMEYNIGRDLIRSSGDSLKLLITKIPPPQKEQQYFN